MIIALLTDFGTQDYYVGAMKGAILSINPEIKIIDITHETAPQDILAASFTLRACYRDFPAKTIFVSVVDPGVGSDRRAILVQTEKYYFIAPDNGLLSFVFAGNGDFRVFEITNESFFRFPVSRTFHGRDVFAPSAAHLANGAKPEEFGKEISDFVRLEINTPLKISENEIEARIINIDRFGNLVINLKKEDLLENFYLEINGHKIEKQRRFFAEAESGELFMIFGSANFLEVAAFLDSAKDLLKAKDGQKVFVKIKN